MKSNISKKEIESGKDIIKLLGEKNPKLLPHHLKEIVPEYQKFSPHPHKYGLWSSTKNKKFEKYDKIVIMASGIAAGGKDAIREEMKRLIPNLFIKAVTGTSRPPREGEVHGQDIYFYNGIEEFKKSIKNGEFVEYVYQGDRLYGLPKKSIDDALKHSSPIIWTQVEMSAWSKLEKYISNIRDIKIGIVKIFILPYMNFSDYKVWLNQKRTDDVESRLTRTGWEIMKAAKKADFIVTNRIIENSNTLTYTTQAIINQILDFLPNLPDTSKFDLPFETKDDISDIESILTFHNSIK
jgi:guanylate kinase